MITVLAGINSQAIREELTSIKKAFTEEYGSQGIETVSAEQLQSEQLSSLLSGATLFALERLVIIRTLSENKMLAEQFLTKLDSISEQTQVVLVEGSLDKRTVFYKTLKKQAELREFAELDEAAAAQWVSEVIKKLSGTISPADMRLLVRYVGTDQARLTSESEKLVAYNPNITKETIELLIEKRPEDTIFQLLEYSLGGRKDQALSVLENLEKAHEDPFQTASMLVWQTNILAIVHSAQQTSDSEIAKSAKINPFVVRKTRNLARNVNSVQIQSILDVVAECDIVLKTGSAKPWRAIERAVILLTK